MWARRSKLFRCANNLAQMSQLDFGRGHHRVTTGGSLTSVDLLIRAPDAIVASSNLLLPASDALATASNEQPLRMSEDGFVRLRDL